MTESFGALRPGEAVDKHPRYPIRGLLHVDGEIDVVAKVNAVPNRVEKP